MRPTASSGRQAHAAGEVFSLGTTRLLRERHGYAIVRLSHRSNRRHAVEIINFLFATPTGVAILIFGGMVLFLIIAFFAERKTHKMYYNHPEEEENEDEWDDDDWDDDEEDEK